jgi:hypothetical protein
MTVQDFEKLFGLQARQAVPEEGQPDFCIRFRNDRAGGTFHKLSYRKGSGTASPIPVFKIVSGRGNTLKEAQRDLAKEMSSRELFIFYEDQELPLFLGPAEYQYEQEDNNVEDNWPCENECGRAVPKEELSDRGFCDDCDDR